VLQPINGLIIAVGAGTLATKRQEELRAEAVELRKRIDEAFRQLEVDCPVYLLVTQCDTIEGFAEFFSCLPERTLEQVLGYVHAPTGQTDTPQSLAAALDFASIAGSLVERLRQLRLSILNEDKLPSPALRQQIFCFPEEFQALQQPLRTFVETLLAEYRQYIPRFRGIFFSSAQQQGPRYSSLRRQFHLNGHDRADTQGARAYFLYDLFALVLPRDQYVVRTTIKAKIKRVLRHLLGFSASSTIAVLLLLFFLQAYWSDYRTYSSVNQQPCLLTASGPEKTSDLAGVEACRQVVQALDEQQQRRFAWNKLVFDRSGKLAEQLRQRYVTRFTAAVLTPLDAGLAQRLTTGPDTIPTVFVLISRIGLLNQCLSVFGCRRTLDQESQPDYKLMFEAGWQKPASTEHVTSLQQTYEAYLRWASGSPEILQREQEAHANRLRGWFALKQFAPQQILLWTNQRYAPVSVQEYWEEFAADGKKALQVDGAYTPAALQQSIIPFLQRAREAVPDMTPLLKEFQNDYREQYFTQWRRFLDEFPRGEALPREARRRLALKLLDEQSPYHRILDTTYANLKPLLPVEPGSNSTSPGADSKLAQQPTNLWSRIWRMVSQWWSKEVPLAVQETVSPLIEPTPPGWVRVLQHYLASESRKTYLEAMQQTRELLTTAPPEKTVQLVQAGFQDGKPSEKSAHPTLRAWNIIQQFRDNESTGAAAAEQPFWPLLERPVQFVWKVMLERTSEFLQKSWEAKVADPVKRLPETEKVDFLYGSQGKIREFANQSAKPFLANNESEFSQILGEKIPLAATFLKTLEVERQLRPLLEQTKGNPPLIRIQTAGDSTIEQDLTNVVEVKTELLVDCDGKPFKVSNRPKDAQEAATSIPGLTGNCGDVTITISMACEQPCVDKAARVGRTVSQKAPLQVTRRYPGQQGQGLREFINHFRSGERTFGRNDLTPKDVLKEYEINKIKVAYKIEVPPVLDTLPSLIPTPLIPSTILK
jgi:type VI secretion system protein ImpL